MIDAEPFVFSTVAAALRAAYASIFVSGEKIACPATFPAVTLVEDDNYTYGKSLDSGGEKHASVMYTANCYSDLSSGKKAQCKAIMEIIDTQMQAMGFIRVGRGPQEVPNIDRDIYRMVARYRAVVSKDLVVYRK